MCWIPLWYMYTCETQSTFHETLQQQTNLFNNALLLHSSLYPSLFPTCTRTSHTHTHTHTVTQVHDRVDPMALACFSASAIGEGARKWRGSTAGSADTGLHWRSFAATENERTRGARSDFGLQCLTACRRGLQRSGAVSICCLCWVLYHCSQF